MRKDRITRDLIALAVTVLHARGDRAVADMACLLFDVCAKGDALGRATRSIRLPEHVTNVRPKPS